jgi:hypothetical protein
MFLCPICQREFSTEEKVVEHSMICWRRNGKHETKHAPIEETIVHREVSNDVKNFFVMFTERK